MFSGIIKHTGKISKIYKNTNNCTIEILSKIKFPKYKKVYYYKLYISVHMIYFYNILYTQKI